MLTVDVGTLSCRSGHHLVTLTLDQSQFTRQWHASDIELTHRMPNSDSPILLRDGLARFELDRSLVSTLFRFGLEERLACSSTLRDGVATCSS
jgi:hypothetical protein